MFLTCGVAQVVEVVAGDIPKEQWLMGHIAEFIDRGDVLVFANQKTRVDMLCDKLKAAGIRCAFCTASWNLPAVTAVEPDKP